MRVTRLPKQPLTTIFDEKYGEKKKNKNEKKRNSLDKTTRQWMLRGNCVLPLTVTSTIRFLPTFAGIGVQCTSSMPFNAERASAQTKLSRMAANYIRKFK